MHMPGFWQFLMILIVVVILFGGKKLPELGSAIGEGIKNFKKGIRDEEDPKKITEKDTDSKSQT